MFDLDDVVLKTRHPGNDTVEQLLCLDMFALYCSPHRVFMAWLLCLEVPMR